MIEREADFGAAVCSLSDALVDASKEHSRRKPRKAKVAKWFNQDVRKAVRIMRKDRKQDHIFHSPHNSLHYHTSLNQLKYKVKKAKHSHTMSFATNIALSKVWSPNSWYRGAHKSLVPALQWSDDSWCYRVCSFTLLLLNSFISLSPTLTSFVLYPFPSICLFPFLICFPLTHLCLLCFSLTHSLYLYILTTVT